MTKSEFAAVQKEISDKYDERFRWLIGTILAVGFSLAGLIVALLHH
jgi:hypothetical protein